MHNNPNAHLKWLKATSKERCHACWLKKCIGTYHLSADHRSRLVNVLPVAMRATVEPASQNSSINMPTLLPPAPTTLLSSASMPALVGAAEATSAYTSPLSPFSIKREDRENQNTVNIFSSSGSVTVTTAVTPSGSNNLATAAASGCAFGKASTSPWSLSPGHGHGSSEAKDGGDSTKFSTNAKKLSSTFSNPLTENNTTFGATPVIVVARAAPVVPLLTDAEARMENGNAKTGAPTKESAPPPPPIVEKNPRGRPRKMPITEQTVSSSLSPAPKEAEATAALSPNSAATDAKRQKIDLKGPRVKHVCRSASIVLGQPLATFPLENMDTPPRPDSPSNVNMVDMTGQHQTKTGKFDCSTCLPEDQQNLALSPPATPIEGDSEMDALDAADSMLPDTIGKDAKPTATVAPPLMPAIPVLAGAREEPHAYKLATRKQSGGRPSLSHNVTNLSHRSSSSALSTIGAASKRAGQMSATRHQLQPPQQLMLSVDFWENYDPVEISQLGFGLIVTESIPVRAICFLCGSCGSPGSLSYCACCGEPYHQYCIEDEYNVKATSVLDETMNISLMQQQNQQDPMIAHLNWMCPRCTVCSTCNMTSGTKVKCQKCQRNYHATCLGTSKRLLGADRPMICAGCLKCKSCGTTTVTKFVGNLPMCTPCFKLRQRGNFCPLCQKCYEQNDFDLKMMECGECEKWVHSRCEGLTDEQYNMLALLPESIEFFCRKCSRKNASLSDVWREAVAAEFKAGLLSVVKLLSKSRQACALLRLSPRKKTTNVSCSCNQSTMSVQKVNNVSLTTQCVTVIM